MNKFKNTYIALGKILCLVIVMTMLFSLACLAEETPISVYINGEKMEFDSAPIMVNDKAMVPVRAIFEKLGAKVLWDSFFERVIINLDEDTTITMYMIDGISYKNNVQVGVDEKPFVSNNRTYVSLGFINNCLEEMSVEWSFSNKRADIIPNYKAMSIIPFGEFMSVPAPVSVNRNFTVFDYQNKDGVAVATFNLNGEGKTDFERYDFLLEAMGFKNIKKADEKDSSMIYYGKNIVLKIEFLENDKFTTTIYNDETGETVKDYIKE